MECVLALNFGAICALQSNLPISQIGSTVFIVSPLTTIEDQLLQDCESDLSKFAEKLGSHLIDQLTNSTQWRDVRSNLPWFYEIEALSCKMPLPWFCEIDTLFCKTRLANFAKN